MERQTFQLWHGNRMVLVYGDQPAGRKWDLGSLQKRRD